MRCDIYVGVSVWSVKAFSNHTHSLPVVLLKSVYVRILICGNACTVPHFKCEAQEKFERFLFFSTRSYEMQKMSICVRLR